MLFGVSMTSAVSAGVIMASIPAVIALMSWWFLGETIHRRIGFAAVLGFAGMALLSLGAAVENLMLTAADLGWASCWVAAPIFCPDEARDALGLPHDWRPHAMVVLGRADASYVGRPRPPVPVDELARFL